MQNTANESNTPGSSKSATTEFSWGGGATISLMSEEHHLGS